MVRGPADGSSAVRPRRALNGVSEWWSSAESLGWQAVVERALHTPWPPQMPGGGAAGDFKPGPAAT